MCNSSPEGYGSISSWYQCFSGAFPGVGFGVWKMSSASHTVCHFSSILCGSYCSISVLRIQKSLSHERLGKLPRRGRVGFLRYARSCSIRLDCTRPQEEKHGRLYARESQNGRRG